MLTKSLALLRKSLVLCLSLYGMLAQAQTLTNVGFDDIATTCASDIDTRGNPFADGCVTGWNSSHGTPDINSANGDHYAFMYGAYYAAYANRAGSEGIFTSYAFQIGQKYTFTFLARNVGNQTGSPTLVLSVANGLQEGGYQGVVPQAVPTAGITRQEVARQVVTADWVQYSITFTPTISASQFWLYTDASINVDANNSIPHQIEINGIDFVKACETADVFYQNTSALPAITKTQGKISAGSTIVTNQPQGSVAVRGGQTVAFRSLGQIALTNDFSVEPGATFSAVVVPCAGYGNKEANAPPSPCSCLDGPYTGRESNPDMSISQSALVERATSNSPSQPYSASVEIYPNPANDRLLITLPSMMHLSNIGIMVTDVQESNTKILGFIYNELGIEVQRVELKPGRNAIPVHSIVPGIYYLRTMWNEKIVKARFSIER